MADKKVLINNTVPRIQTIGVRQDDGEILDIKLMPGINEVDADQWAKAVKDSPVLKNKVDEEEIVVQGTGTILNSRLPDAKRIISQTLDRELLTAWKAADKRPAVIAAIDEQLNLIKPDGKAPPAQTKK